METILHLYLPSMVGKKVLKRIKIPQLMTSIGYLKVKGRNKDPLANNIAWPGVLNTTCAGLDLLI